MRAENGVKSVFSLADGASRANAIFNGNNPKWLAPPREKMALSQAVGGFDTSTGLLNFDCSVMPVNIYLTDHRGETVSRVVFQAKKTADVLSGPKIRFSLAGGNAGLMAAVNEVLTGSLLPCAIVVYLMNALVVFVLFRSWRGTLCILYPLIVVSTLTYGAMRIAGIGFTLATLPVTIFGAGIGVDFSVYLYGCMQQAIKQGRSLGQSYRIALRTAGKAVLVAGLLLIAGAGFWIFSDLRLQVDMGLLLAFMFFFNLLGTLFLFPALIRLFPPWDVHPDGRGD
jgi:predicted RND superfamily exporter protein